VRFVLPAETDCGYGIISFLERRDGDDDEEDDCDRDVCGDDARAEDDDDSDVWSDGADGDEVSYLRGPVVVRYKRRRRVAIGRKSRAASVSDAELGELREALSRLRVIVLAEGKQRRTGRLQGAGVRRGPARRRPPARSPAPDPPRRVRALPVHKANEP
jgi:hypothetical protein